MKGLGVFLRFFIPAYRGPAQKQQQQRKPKTTESKFKDAEEVDFIEIKDDKKTTENKT